MDITEVNSLTDSDFIHLFGNVVENYKDCAIWLSKLRPFDDRKNILNFIEKFLSELSTNEKERVLQLHPDLAGRFVNEAHLTFESQLEQRSAGLRNIGVEDSLELSRLNKEYKSKFNFPFVICARDNKFESILRGLKERISHAKEEELIIGIQEVKKITCYRISELIID